jgi:hypothetical protein
VQFISVTACMHIIAEAPQELCTVWKYGLYDNDIGIRSNICECRSLCGCQGLVQGCNQLDGHILYSIACSVHNMRPCNIPRIYATNAYDVFSLNFFWLFSYDNPLPKVWFQNRETVGISCLDVPSHQCVALGHACFPIAMLSCSLSM